MWQVAILAGALAVIVGLRRSVVLTLVGAGVIGAVGAAWGCPSDRRRAAVRRGGGHAEQGPALPHGIARRPRSAGATPPFGRMGG